MCINHNHSEASIWRQPSLSHHCTNKSTNHYLAHLFTPWNQLIVGHMATVSTISNQYINHSWPSWGNHSVPYEPWLLTRSTIKYHQSSFTNHYQQQPSPTIIHHQSSFTIRPDPSQIILNRHRSSFTIHPKPSSTTIFPNSCWSLSSSTIITNHQSSSTIINYQKSITITKHHLIIN